MTVRVYVDQEPVATSVTVRASTHHARRSAGAQAPLRRGRPGVIVRQGDHQRQRRPHGGGRGRAAGRPYGHDAAGCDVHRDVVGQADLRAVQRCIR